ncbi:MAG: GAF domain-containing sensor histidine kinase [Solirubrobacterales bacterium]|nr:GAF domain-containing sensor histidine kinase [Solirubrobacterales bacterium]MBV9716193.1 GAF domain-containing sensor histidine kinase [Solirubrobacterales bacterium]
MTQIDQRLVDAGRTLVSELDSDTVLARILEEAQRLTGARYAALGVLDEGRQELGRFVTAGLDEASRRRIGAYPRGRGVLGVLIEDPRPLRVAEVGEHPESYGFPPAHPMMHSFLGVPIVIRGQVWGNLYLAEKQGAAEFTEADEEAAMALARWAAIAIENARIHRTSEERREQLERAVRSLEAAREITDAIGSVADLERVLELIVKRGRALVGARSLLIMLREGDELVVVTGAGHARAVRGHRLPIRGSTCGHVLERGRARRVSDVASEMRISPAGFGVPDPRTALLVPLMHRGTAIGVLAAFDHGTRGDEFSAADERLLRAFAQSAANAVAIKRSVEADRLRSAIAAADAERARWARELHDETLQALGGLRVLLASTLGRGDAQNKDAAIRQAVEDIELEIANLREIITDLRPSLLDDLGLLPAIEALLERRRDDTLRIESDLRLPADDDGSRLAAELETTVYRLVQEALTNVGKHAQATSAYVSVRLEDDEVVVEVCDDGRGFDVSARSAGFGLPGMRERVALAGGTLGLQSGQAGTRLRARLPLVPAMTAAPRPVLDAADEMTG